MSRKAEDCNDVKTEICEDFPEGKAEGARPSQGEAPRGRPAEDQQHPLIRALTGQSSMVSQAMEEAFKHDPIEIAKLEEPRLGVLMSPGGHKTGSSSPDSARARVGLPPTDSPSSKSAPPSVPSIVVSVEGEEMTTEFHGQWHHPETSGADVCSDVVRVITSSHDSRWTKLVSLFSGCSSLFF